MTKHRTRTQTSRSVSEYYVNRADAEKPVEKNLFAERIHIDQTGHDADGHYYGNGPGRHVTGQKWYRVTNDGSNRGGVVLSAPSAEVAKDIAGRLSWGKNPISDGLALGLAALAAAGAAAVVYYMTKPAAAATAPVTPPV